MQKNKGADQLCSYGFVFAYVKSQFSQVASPIKRLRKNVLLRLVSFESGIVVKVMMFTK